MATRPHSRTWFNPHRSIFVSLAAAVVALLREVTEADNKREARASTSPPTSGVASGDEASAIELGALRADLDAAKLRLAAVGRVGHDINNALAVVVALASSLADTSADEDTRIDAKTILQASERITSLSKRLSALAKGVPVHAEGESPASGRASVAPSAPLLEARGVLVVVVDDEPVVAKSTARLLERYGFSTAVCVEPADAYDALAKAAPGRRCLLTDVVMPGISGVDLALEARRRFPDLPVLLMSGYTGNVDVAASGLECVEKPFEGKYVAQRLLALVGGAAAVP